MFASSGRGIVKAQVSGLGFSSAALAVLANCASVLIVVTMVVGFRVLKPPMPPVRFNSAILAAACQRAEREVEAHKEVVGWKVDTEGEIEVRHCGFRRS